MRIIYITLILLCLQSCNKKTVDMTQTISYLALGDSYTIGEKVDSKERWPQQLVDRLNKDGLKVDNPEIIAVTGWTTDELKNGIAEARISQQTYDLVSLLIGVNNQYRGRDLVNFKQEFVELLIQAIEFAGSDVNNVFVVSIPDWGVTPFAEGRDREKIATEIDAYNAIVKEETEKRGIKYIDITTVSKKAGDNLDLNASDGLHPSGKLYEAWTDEIHPVVLELLK